MPDFSSLWGGQGFGGIGNFGLPGATPGLLNQQPAMPPAPVSAPGGGSSVGQNLAALWGGQGFGQGPAAQAAQQLAGGGTFTNPAQGQDLWGRVMNALGPGAGGFKMPGTTVGAPAGQAAPPPPQAPIIPGVARQPVNFQVFPQMPGAGGGAGNSGLMQQYMMLQQLMAGR